jgi:mannose-6-phosphate isomerase-like protein (cupin superfamily)
MPSVPSVVSLNEVSPVRRNGDYGVARLIDRERNGSELLMGLEWFEPGEITRWSFEAVDRTDGREEFFGERHETYFVLRGRLRLSWDGGSVEFGVNDAVHIPPGNRYVLESLGPDTAELVYAITPSL